MRSAKRSRECAPNDSVTIMLKRWFAYVYIMPVFLILIGVLVLPSLAAIVLGFFERDFFSPTTRFIGLGNYLGLIAGRRFFMVMRNTLIYTIGAVVLEFVLGLGIALLLNRELRGMRIIRAGIISPWVISPVIVGLIWRMMFHSNFGVINYLLGLIWKPLGNIGWLFRPYPALFVNILADVWQNTPFVAMLLLAGLQVLPQEPYEAAKMDGASAWQTLIYITLPMLMPSILAVMVFRTIWAFREFTMPFTITAGGPGYSTEVFSIYLYRILMKYYDIGTASAVGSIMLLVTTLLSFGMLHRMWRGFQE